MLLCAYRLRLVLVVVRPDKGVRRTLLLLDGRRASLAVLVELLELPPREVELYLRLVVGDLPDLDVLQLPFVRRVLPLRLLRLRLLLAEAVLDLLDVRLDCSLLLCS